ncbi:MAG: sulfatase-like hydrolase/transferase, partial [Armatimonadota bacterium]|nr:sulfatase-like hydrolase/transferase [Armatimonadota bacterium]
TDLLTDYAVNWLRRPRRAPFCLVVGHKACHGPFTPAPRHADAFPSARLPEPASYNQDLADKPALRLRGGRGGVSVTLALPEPPPPWRGDEPGRINYFRTLLAVDESVGRLLQTLQEMGELDNTLFVFASDNGYFHGEQRRGDKRFMHEESLRIPLLVRYPPLVRAGTVVADMALNIDIAPTFLDMAGLRVPESMQGRSLRPLLAGARGSWRREFLYEYFQERNYPTIPTVIGVRTTDWAYMHYPYLQDADELYDLRQDPKQLRNLAKDPAHAAVLARLKEDLERLKRETRFRMPPEEPQQPAAAPRQRLNAYVLSYELGKSTQQDRFPDASGQGNDGTGKGIAPVEDASGKKACRFDGRSRITAPKSKSLDCSLGPWSVSALVKAESPDGVILAHGGRSQGFSLYLQEGRPRFSVTVDGQTVSAAGKEGITGRWTHLAGILGEGGRVSLYVDGTLAATVAAPGYIAREPSEGMQIGLDDGTPVVPYARPGGFVGLIARVRVYSGALSPAQVLADARE